MPLWMCQQMRYQLDGAPAHYAHAISKCQNATFPQHWIGWGGPISWPLQSPYLTPTDFFLWGSAETVVYESPVEKVEELIARIVSDWSYANNSRIVGQSTSVNDVQMLLVQLSWWTSFQTPYCFLHTEEREWSHWKRGLGLEPEGEKEERET
jgi:hypothetical protein